MEHLANILEYGLQIIEMVSTAILLIGFGKACTNLIRNEWSRWKQRAPLQDLSGIRLQLGTYILLGLDFYIVSDIIHSMIRPEFNELINLALIVVLRTTIGFFLGKEIAEIENRSQQDHQ